VENQACGQFSTDHRRYARSTMFKTIVKLSVCTMLLFNIACAKNNIYPENYFSNRQSPSYFPQINIVEGDIYIEGNYDEILDLKKNIVESISLYFRSTDNKIIKSKINIVSVDVRIENQTNNKMLPMVIASTLFFPMSFVRQKKSINYYVNYNFIDEGSHQLFKRDLYGSISGRFLGWSFFRYTFSDELYRDQSYLLPRAISGLICNDLIEIYKQIKL
jgi:hypothetical protein